MTRMRVLEVSGSFYDMGYQHGKQYYDAIHMFTEDRVHLCGDPNWSGRDMTRDEVLALAEATVESHKAYSPELMQELGGMAEATGLSVAELIINNGFTDFVDTIFALGGEPITLPPPLAIDDCTAFLVPNNQAENQHGMAGQTWDMHDSATPHVMLLRGKPTNAPNFLIFTIAGCLGMIGMNEHGISVGINNLVGSDGQTGVTWIFVIRKMLMQDNIEDALACITEANLAGAHNYYVMDKHGKGYNVEAMSSTCHITPLEHEPIVHTNHCLVPNTRDVERERSIEGMSQSIARLNQGYALLNKETVTPDDLMALTADKEAICRESDPIWHSETCGAVVMRPATLDMWACWGRPDSYPYEQFTVA